LLYYLCCKNLKKKRREKQGHFFELKSSYDEIKNELDVVTLIRNMRYLRLMMRVLFTVRE